MSELRRTIRIKVEGLDKVHEVRLRVVVENMDLLTRLERVLSASVQQAQQAASQVSQAASTSAQKASESVRRSIDATSRAATQAFANQDNAARQTQYALLTLSQTLQDLPFGYRAVANNIEVLIQQLIHLNKEAGGFRNMSRLLFRDLVGPTGLFLAFSAFSAALVMFGDRFVGLFDRMGAAVRSFGKQAGDVIKELTLGISAVDLSRIGDLIDEELKRISKLQEELRQQLPQAADLVTRLSAGPFQLQPQPLRPEVQQIEEQLKSLKTEEARLRAIQKAINARREETQKFEELLERASQLIDKETRIDGLLKEQLRTLLNQNLQLEAQLRAIETAAFQENVQLRRRIQLAELAARISLQEAALREIQEKGAQALEAQSVLLERRSQLLKSQIQLLSSQALSAELTSIALLSRKLELEQNLLDLARKQAVEQDRQVARLRTLLFLRERGLETTPEALGLARLERLQVPPVLDLARPPSPAGPIRPEELRLRRLPDYVVQDLEQKMRSLTEAFDEATMQTIMVANRLATSLSDAATTVAVGLFSAAGGILQGGAVVRDALDALSVALRRFASEVLAIVVERTVARPLAEQLATTFVPALLSGNPAAIGIGAAAAGLGAILGGLFRRRPRRRESDLMQPSWPSWITETIAMQNVRVGSRAITLPQPEYLRDVAELLRSDSRTITPPQPEYLKDVAELLRVSNRTITPPQPEYLKDVAELLRVSSRAITPPQPEYLKDVAELLRVGSRAITLAQPVQQFYPPPRRIEVVLRGDLVGRVDLDQLIFRLGQTSTLAI